MAIVGDAYVVVRAITTQVESDIKNAFNGVDRVAENAGKDINRNISKGLKSGGGLDFGDMFTKSFLKEAENAKEAFTSLTRAGYFLAPAISAVASIIGVLVTSLISLGSVVIAGAIPGILNMVGALGVLALAAVTAKLAFAGVGEAISAGNKAAKAAASPAQAKAKAAAALAEKRATQDLAKLQETQDIAHQLGLRKITDATDAYTRALEKAKQQLKDLAFSSEDAGIAEKKAAIDLEKARETLARVSDLPPNSRVRKEAELAFAQADLNYRKAIDANNVLKKQEAKNAAISSDPLEQAKGQLEVVAALREKSDAVSDLTKADRDAKLTMERAKEDLAIQRDALANFDNLTSSATAYKDALAALSPEAQAFVKFIVSLTPIIKSLQAAAGKDFFPKLIEAIKILLPLIPVLKPLLQATGKVLGEIAVKIAKIFTKPENVALIKKIWEDANVALGFFGDALVNVLDFIINLWAALGPYIIEFAKWVDTITAGWTETLKADVASGKFKKTMDLLTGTMKDLGDIFGNTIGGLGKLIMNNIGPGSGGQKFLDYFKDLTEKFKNLKEIDGKPVKQFFSDAADNGIKLTGILGDIIFAFIRLADNKGFGKFLDSIKSSVKVFSQIGEDMDVALPSVGKFIEQFTEFFKKVFDPGSIKIFFDVLTTAFDKLNNFLDSDIGKTILDLSNKFLPILAALGLLSSIGGTAFKILVGAIDSIIGPFSKLDTLFRSTASWLADLGPLGETLAGSLGTIVIVVVAVVAALVLMWQKSEIFRKAIKDLVSGVMAELKTSFDAIKEAIDKAHPAIDAIGGVFKVLGDIVGTVLVPIIKFVLVNAIKIVTSFIVELIGAIGRVTGAFKAVWDFLKPIVSGITNLISGMVSTIRNILGGIGGAFKSAFSGVLNIVRGPINALIDAWNNTLGRVKVTLPKILGFGGGTIGFPTIPKLPDVQALAAGGTIFPSAGGTLARIAEAGRPERVEPLDPDGLSKRDKAMITLLSGGAGKGVTVNVHPSAGMDERELAAMVSRQITYAIRSGSS